MFKSGVDRIGADGENADLVQRGEHPGHSIMSPGSPAREQAAPLSPEKFPTVADVCDLYDKESELTLPCFIMMLDLSLKQVQVYL